MEKAFSSGVAKRVFDFKSVQTNDFKIVTYCFQRDDEENKTASLHVNPLEKALNRIPTILGSWKKVTRNSKASSLLRRAM